MFRIQTAFCFNFIIQKSCFCFTYIGFKNLHIVCSSIVKNRHIEKKSGSENTDFKHSPLERKIKHKFIILKHVANKLTKSKTRGVIALGRSVAQHIVYQGFQPRGRSTSHTPALSGFHLNKKRAYFLAKVTPKSLLFVNGVCRSIRFIIKT